MQENNFHYGNVLGLEKLICFCHLKDRLLKQKLYHFAWNLIQQHFSPHLAIP